MLEEKNNKRLVVGDLHLRPLLGYSDFLPDGRVNEERDILDFIIQQSADCDKIIFLGDQLNAKNNHSSVIDKLVNFLESFDGKELFILGGNHERFSNGTSALDFLREIKGKNWHIITKGIEKIGDMVFLPYTTKESLGCNTNSEAVSYLMDSLPGGSFLFHHHSMTGTSLISGLPVDSLPEPILPSDKLLKIFKFVVGGHIHNPQICKKYKGKIIVAGSIFNNEIGESNKCLWKIEKDETIKKILLPGRGIFKIENPTESSFATIPKNSIVKVIITKEISNKEKEEIRTWMSRFDSAIYIEQIPRKRNKQDNEKIDSIADFSIENLLAIYGKERKINYTILKRGFDLIQ